MWRSEALTPWPFLPMTTLFEMHDLCSAGSMNAPHQKKKNLIFFWAGLGAEVEEGLNFLFVREGALGIRKVGQVNKGRN